MWIRRDQVTLGVSEHRHRQAYAEEEDEEKDEEEEEEDAVLMEQLAAALSQRIKSIYDV